MLSYDELITYLTFEDRLRYLILNGKVGSDKWGHSRYLNQILYNRSPEWKRTRQNIILRDNACDLGIDDYPICNVPVYIHHINPITEEQLLNNDPCIFDENNLICCSFNTHQIIHYGTIDDYIKTSVLIERKPNDLCPWK